MLRGKHCTGNHYSLVIDHDADVYTVDKRLLLRFRKAVLDQNHVGGAYENIINFAKGKNAPLRHGNKTPGSSRGASNIAGYFDTWDQTHKRMFRDLGVDPPSSVRETSFTANQPHRWRAVVPLIEDIDRMYKKLTPEYHKNQHALSSQTAYRISSTSFSTITVNVNVQTAFHTDSNNVQGSYGNLIVMGEGDYTGGFTVMPRYGVAIDVRPRDFLAMDVHEMHGNSKINLRNAESIRLSMVCYLRQGVLDKSRGTTQKDLRENKKALDDVHEHWRSYNAVKNQRR